MERSPRFYQVPATMLVDFMEATGRNRIGTGTETGGVDPAKVSVLSTLGYNFECKDTM